ncbi:hypothetical protein [Falsirhodobacter sp. 1013]|uniref:hypothetical protein n=1 Tax=Falsirhodobacter sp. 1013 TaxID=3417566 RepID=UPI003EB7DE0C
MTRHELISEIETYAARKGIAPATVTSRAVNNSRLYRRLKADHGCTLDVAGRIMAFIAADGAAPKEQGAA